MNQKRVVLVAQASDSAVVQHLSSRFHVSGLLTVGRKGIPVDGIPRFRDAVSLLDQAGCDVCVVLSPTRNLTSDLAPLTEAGVKVLSAGPPTGTSRTDHGSAEWTVSSPQITGDVYRGLRDRCRTRVFGTPVYLRYLSGGGTSISSAWWAATQAIDQALDLLEGKVESLMVSAVTRERRYHLNITLALSNRSNGQLSIVPEYLDSEAEYSLLGTGGLLAYSGRENASGVVSNGQLTIQKRSDQCPHTRWLSDFLNGRCGLYPPSVDARQSRKLRQAIGDSVARGEPVPLTVK